MAAVVQTRSAQSAWQGLHPAFRIAIVYLLARLVTFGFLFIAAVIAPVDSRFGPGLNIGRFLTAWDGQWYWLVGESGYPAVLPTNDEGQVAENAWAFMPLYPWISKVVGLAAGSWPSGAVLVTFVCGYLASLALYRLLRNRLTEAQAFWAVVFFVCSPLGALFHIAYAEMLFALLLFLGLDALLRRRFWLLYLIIPAMGFTRPGVLPFALLLGLYGLYRLRQRRRDPLPARQIVHILALGALAAAVGLSWQVIAWLVTGDPSAYLSTELAWRRNWIPDASGGFIPFEGWIAGLTFWSGYWGVPVALGLIVFLVALVALVVMVWKASSFRALGPELRLWMLSYALYLLAVFFPQSSTLRLLLPLSPAWGAAAVAARTATARTVILVISLGYQLFWIIEVFAYATQITQIP